MRSNVLKLEKSLSKKEKIFREICSKYNSTTGVPDPFKTQDFLDFITILDALLNTKFRDHDNFNESFLSVALVSSWKKYKQEFSFDVDFAQEIISEALPQNLPVHVLQRAPFNELYIQNPEIEDSGWFFVSKEDQLFVAQAGSTKIKGGNHLWCLDLKPGKSLTQAIAVGSFEYLQSLEKALSLYQVH